MEDTELDNFLELEFYVASGQRFNYKPAWDALVKKFKNSNDEAFKFICAIAIGGFKSQEPVARFVEKDGIVEQKLDFKFDRNVRDPSAMTIRRCIAYCSPAIRAWLMKHPNQKTVLGKNSNGPNHLLFIGAEYCVKNEREKDILIEALKLNLEKRSDANLDQKSFLLKTSTICDYSINNNKK